MMPLAIAQNEFQVLVQSRARQLKPDPISSMQSLHTLRLDASDFPLFMAANDAARQSELF
jgi:hypothetical protein